LGGRGRWISEFEASLVYRVSFRTARATQRKPVLEKKRKKNPVCLKCVALGSRVLASSSGRQPGTMAKATVFTVLRASNANLKGDFSMPFPGVFVRVYGS
jgi:hypothetical protein